MLSEKKIENESQENEQVNNSIHQMNNIQNINNNQGFNIFLQYGFTQDEIRGLRMIYHLSALRNSIANGRNIDLSLNAMYQRENNWLRNNGNNNNNNNERRNYVRIMLNNNGFRRRRYARVYRYESNEIENMSITILEPLAKALHTTPAELCGWNNTDLTPGEYALLSDFRKLNPAGQQFAAATVKGITQMPQYTSEEKEETRPLEDAAASSA